MAVGDGFFFGTIQIVLLSHISVSNGKSLHEVPSIPGKIL